MLKNDLLLKALKQETVPRPPVWLMRQAGRYLPQYMKIRNKYDFFTCIKTPELACEITLQPVNILGVDAAIIFSDILVVPSALGMNVHIDEATGPVLAGQVCNEEFIENIDIETSAENLNYVYEALKLTKKELNGRIPLIGFAGAPFTLLCYMVEGTSRKGFVQARAFCFSRPQLAGKLLQKLTDAVIQYLIRQVRAGADVVQVFDSWSGLLGPADFNRFAAPYLNQIAQALAPHAPVIIFPRGSNYALPGLSENTAISALSVDWTVTPQEARKATANRTALQGNMDPARLMMPAQNIKNEVQQMISQFGVKGYIVNLGHGITPDIPVDNVKLFVNAVKNYKPQV